MLLGVALLTKFTLFVFLGVWPVLAVVYFSPTRTWPKMAGHGLLLLGLAGLVLNTGFGWRGVFQPLGHLPFVSQTLAGPPPAGGLYYDQGRFGNRFANSWLGALPMPLPADFLRGLDLQRRDFEARWPSYLAGQWQYEGWWYYYLYALAVKLPLGLWGLFLWRWWRPPGLGSWRDEWALWLPAVVVLATASAQTGFSHHLRYVLPLFPFVLIGTARVAGWWSTGGWQRRMALSGLLLATGASSLAVFPQSLAYFNELAGGPANGPTHLLYSNVDWGQDLLTLRSWLDDHPEAHPIQIAYYNAVGPEAVGLTYALLPIGSRGLAADDPGYAYSVGPQPGWYAVSVNLVWGAPAVLLDGQGGFRQVPINGYAYFRHFTPIAHAGWSINLYHLSLAEVNHVRKEFLALPALSGKPFCPLQSIAARPGRVEARRP
jgi:hypothetical protein